MASGISMRASRHRIMPTLAAGVRNRLGGEGADKGGGVSVMRVGSAGPSGSAQADGAMCHADVRGVER